MSYAVYFFIFLNFLKLSVNHVSEVKYFYLHSNDKLTAEEGADLFHFFSNIVFFAFLVMYVFVRYI